MDILLLIGISIFAGFYTGRVFNRLKFPAVVGYLIAGILLGPSFLNVFPLDITHRLGIISDLALGIVAFNIGNELKVSVLKKMGSGILTIILAESLAAFLLVFIGIYLLTGELALSLIFGSLAVASAPAGTWVVLREYRARGPLTDTILAVVGLDDALAIVIFGFAAGIAKVILSHTGSFSFSNCFLEPVLKSSEAILLGTALGIIIIYIMRRLKNRDDMFKITIGAITVCTGIANICNISVILSNLFMGLTMTNIFLMTSRKAVESINKVAPTIYIIFFVLAGAHLQIGLLPTMGMIGLTYIVCRIIGKLSGAYAGSILSGASGNVKKYLGMAILSQAGVAVGLALLVGRNFSSMGPEGEHLAKLAINTIAATTIIFELIGPLTAKIAITKAGEAGRKNRR
ncbi:MAG: cation:proton antiporter [Elusimicrobiota bacterium]